MAAARQVAKRTRRGLMLGIGVSVAVHGAGVAWALSGSSKVEPPRIIQNAIPVQLVKLGKKRDPELLPRKVTEAPPPPPDTVKLDTGQPVPTAAPVDKPKHTDQMSDAAKRLLDRETKLDRALEKVEAEGDPEGDEEGTTTDTTNAARGYEASVAKVLKSNYQLPEAIPAGQRQFLLAKVVLYIEANGKLSRFEFEERHPNTLFMGALESMLSNIQLPPPPPSEAARVASDGLLVVFRP